MTQTASVTSGSGIQSNNLDTLRLLLAFLVVLEHSNNLFHVALGSTERFSFFLFNLSDIAVSAFFIISGMLTYLSFERDPDIIRFYLRRFFRVFPAYWAIILVQIVAFCVFATALVKWDVVPIYALVNFVTANFLQASFVDGISALNGSLWTIKIEASYYLLLPLLFPLLTRSPFLLIIAVLSLLWAVALPSDTFSKQLPGKLYLFIAGVALARMSFYLTSRLSLWGLLLLPLAIWAKFATEDNWGIAEVAEVFASVIFVVAFLNKWMRREFMDISYTLYLVHYPILVLVTQILLPGHSFSLILVVGVVSSLAFAIFFSILVERPALRYGRRLVAVSGKSLKQPLSTARVP